MFRAGRVESRPRANLVERISGTVTNVMEFVRRARPEVDRAPIQH